MNRVIISVVCLLISSISANAQNWPSFRGPNASGVVEGSKYPATWSLEKNENVLWRTEIPGLSHASPIVWDNRVFVITSISEAKPTFQAKDKGIGLANDDAKHTWHIYGLDKNNGKILWTNQPYAGVPRAKRHVKASQANSTPVTDGRYVVAVFGSEGMACYNFSDGKLLWKQDLGVLDPGLWDDKNSSWGHSSSPIIYRDLVIVQADGHKQSFIAAFNLKDGKQRWRVERDEITSWSTPAIYQGKNRTELIANGGRYIRGYDPLTGKELWRFSDSDTQVKMQVPVIGHDLIYVAGGYPPGRPIYAFRPGAVGDISLKPGETKNNFLAWKTVNGSPYTPTPLLYGDLFYALADNGVLSAYDAKTGERIYQQRLPSSFSASPVAANDRLYLASEDGDVFVVKAGRQYELLARNVMGQPLMATPALSQGMLIVRGENAVYALGER